jgi:hypothetical protein
MLESLCSRHAAFRSDLGWLVDAVRSHIICTSRRVLLALPFSRNKLRNYRPAHVRNFLFHCIVEVKVEIRILIGRVITRSVYLLM